MPLSIQIPLLGKGGDTRDLIISILAEEWPLSLKEIHRRIVGFGKNITYQAAHKAIKQLEMERTLVRTGKLYSLSEEWMEQFKAFSDRVAQKRIRVKLSGTKTTFPITLTLRNMLELGQLATRFSEQTYFAEGGPSKKDVAVAHWRHTWPGIFMVEKEFDRLQRIFTVPHFILVRGKTAADVYLAKMLEKMNARVLIGADCADTSDVVVHRRFVLYIHYPAKLRRALDCEYGRIWKKDIPDLSGLQKAVHGEYGAIRVVILEDSGLAQQIVEDALARFPKRTR